MDKPFAEGRHTEPLAESVCNRLNDIRTAQEVPADALTLFEECRCIIEVLLEEIDAVYESEEDDATQTLLHELHKRDRS